MIQTVSTTGTFYRLFAPWELQPCSWDRLEHNDDIDKRIIREIENCDFVVADLTYARQSVYFEAGYAQRKVPVVYICRADHLGQGFGELRVHFDLLMRNIVPWNSPKDRSFALKLAKRIKVVISPLIQKRESDAKAKADEAQFQGQPLVARVSSVAETFKNALQTSGYRSFSERDSHNNPWFGRVRIRKVLKICGLFSYDQALKMDIRGCVKGTLDAVSDRFDPPKFGIYGGLKAPAPGENKGVKKIVVTLSCAPYEEFRGNAWT